LSSKTLVAATNAKYTPRAMALTLDECRRVVEYWAEALCLNDWVIDVEMRRIHTMRHALGTCYYTYSKSRATIAMTDPRDHDPNSDPVDMEAVIVHELLHLHYAAIKELVEDDCKHVVGELENSVCFERPIERLAWALLRLRRSSSVKSDLLGFAFSDDAVEVPNDDEQ